MVTSDRSHRGLSPPISQTCPTHTYSASLAAACGRSVDVTGIHLLFFGQQSQFAMSYDLYDDKLGHLAARKYAILVRDERHLESVYEFVFTFNTYGSIERLRALSPYLDYVVTCFVPLEGHMVNPSGRSTQGRLSDRWTDETHPLLKNLLSSGMYKAARPSVFGTVPEANAHMSGLAPAAMLRETSSAVGNVKPSITVPLADIATGVFQVDQPFSLGEYEFSTGTYVTFSPLGSHELVINHFTKEQKPILINAGIFNRETIDSFLDEGLIRFAFHLPDTSETLLKTEQQQEHYELSQDSYVIMVREIAGQGRRLIPIKYSPEQIPSVFLFKSHEKASLVLESYGSPPDWKLDTLQGSFIARLLQAIRNSGVTHVVIDPCHDQTKLVTPFPIDRVISDLVREPKALTLTDISAQVDAKRDCFGSLLLLSIFAATPIVLRIAGW